ncbi:MAG: amidophosphoribosyltransferase, partial [Saccharolobus sp.]
MAGILGILAFDEVWNISKFLFYGLIGLQHRGYVKSGISVLKDGKIYSKLSDLAPEDLNIEGLDGWAGIGYTGTRYSYPIVFENGSVVVDGIVKDVN